MNLSRKTRLEEVKTEIKEVKHDMEHIKNDTLMEWAKDHLDELNREKKDGEDEAESQRWIF